MKSMRVMPVVLRPLVVSIRRRLCPTHCQRPRATGSSQSGDYRWPKWVLLEAVDQDDALAGDEAAACEVTTSVRLIGVPVELEVLEVLRQAAAGVR